MRRLGRPLLHFFLLAGLGFAAVQTSGIGALAPAGPGVDAARAGDPVVIDAVRRAQLVEDWRARFGADPDEAALQRLVAHALDEEILFREALRLGLDRIDPVVRRRLAQNMRFLAAGRTPAAPVSGANLEAAREPVLDHDLDGGGDNEWVARARALDMHRTDVVVRRRLVQRMQATIDARAPSPTREELRHFVETHPDRFLSAGRARLAYGFGDVPAESALPFRGTFDEAEIEALLGAAFRTALPSLARGAMTGPWRGPHGEAWVVVEEVVPPAPHPFEYVEERAGALLSQRARDRVRRETMQSLRARYGVSRTGLADGARRDLSREADG